jgi:hypothetical protein
MSRLLELDAYLTGELADGDALDAFEEAMFDAPDDEDLAFVDVLARRGAVLASHGTFDMGILRAQVEELRARGESISLTEIGPPGTYSIVFPREGRLVCTALDLGRTDIDRVDVELRLVDHDNAMKMIRDCVVDPTDGKIYAMCERPLFELTIGAGLVHTKIFRHGKRELLGEWHVTGSLAPA